MSSLIDPLPAQSHSGLHDFFKWAGRALRNELLDFRFHYPIEAVPVAGPKQSLHYYVYSDRLFFDVMRLTGDGVPVQRSRLLGTVVNPAYVAWFGLMNLERNLRGLEPTGREIFLKQIQRLVAHGVSKDDGSIVWPYLFDWNEGHCFFKAPWISSISQGLAISALVRGYRLTGRPQLLDVAMAATLPFETPIEKGGVRTEEGGHVHFEEYPGYPLARVLDGFLFSLLGLYDLLVETEDRNTRQLFSDGVNGLTRTIEFWDYRKKWTWYGSHGFLCLPQYNVLNSCLLAALGRLSGERRLSEYATQWNPRSRSWLDRIEVFSIFLLTKQWARIRFFRLKS